MSRRWTRGPEHEPPAASLWDLVVAQATRRPEAVAVRQWHATLTYADLVGAAAALADRLRALGVRPETRVGICARRGPSLPVAVLGVLAAGGAYVPLDPAHPRRRLDDICADAGLDVVVVDEDGERLLGDSGRRLVPLPPDVAPGVAPFTGDPARPVASNTAYVLYTSGSTGRPKGVAVSQHSLASFVTAAGRHFGLDGTCRSIAFSALGFDVSVLDLLTPLTCGGSVQLVPDADRVDPARLQRFLEAHEVTWGFVPPALLPLLDPTRLPTLRDVVTAGEPPGPEQVARWSAPPRRRLHNWYGPTETTVCVVGGELTGDWQRPVPIGRPLAGCRAYVLDERMEPCPPGVPGELYVGGPQVALGYWRRPGLTAERFVPDPYGCRPGARLYRTGDRAAWEPDGRIAYLGRLDRQVKIQGQRVEIGEVEAVVRAHPRVSQAVVDVDPGPDGPDAEPGGPAGGLVAFVTPDDAPDLAQLRDHCAARLPAYMLPTRVVRLSALPLTTAGKTDLRALRERHRRPAVAGPEQEPAGPVAATVAAAWAEVLRVRPAPGDGFLDAGGHSLGAMRLVSALRDRLGRDVAVEDVYAGRTLAGLTRRVEAAPALHGELAVGNPPALSTAQRRMWFVEQVAPGTPTHTIALAERLRGPLDLAALRAALAGVAERHQPLRWRVPQRAGTPYVEVDAATVPPLPLLDLSDRPPEERERALRAALDAAALTPFDLAAGPLWRATVLRLAADEHVLALTVHHLVFDGWSQDVLYRDLAAGYAAALDGRPPDRPPLRAEFPDYVAALTARANRHGGAHLRWWVDRLADAPTVCDLPRDRPRPVTQSFRGAARVARLDPVTTAAVRSLARRAGSTPHIVLLAAFAQLVRRLTGQSDLIVGVPFADRDHVAFEPLVGLLLQILPLRLRVDDEESFTAHVRRCTEELRLAVEHRDAPLDRVVDALRVPRDLGRNPLIQVLFNMYTFPPARLDLRHCAAQPVPAGLPGSLFDLTLYVSEQGDGLHLQAVYNPDLYDAERIDALLDTYTHLVGGLTGAPDAPVGHAPARPPACHLPDWRTPLSRRDGVPVLRRIAGRVVERPDATAVTGAGGALTYRALDELRRRVAAAVGAAGIGPGETVAVLATRHVALPALLLGVLSAGARWAVLDTALPAARLARQATAAAAKALLACPDVAVPEELAHLIRVEPADGPAPPDDGVAPPGGYLSFTSGTTGEPQVVASGEAALAAFLDWYPDTVPLGPHDRFALLAGLGHDPVLRDVCVPLVHGARLAVPEQASLRDPARLGSWLRDQRVTVAHLTPQLGRMLTEGPVATALPDLRLAVVAGDQLTPADVARLRALAPHARLVNAYGTTETPQIHGWYPVPADPPGDVVPVGRGAPGSALVVVDRLGRPAAVGELGEVVVRSRHLATGYLDPEATGRRFTRTPGGSDEQDRRYRTGDLGRHRPDGTVVLAGRTDHQVKVRGYRVELAEIEAALAAHPDVRTAAAVVGAFGGEQGVRAFVAPAQPDVRVADLVAHLRARFPEYAVPGQVHLVPAIPLTANGKVDRSALAGIVPRPRARPVDDELRTRTERLVAGVWRSVLGRPRVGAEENFFEAGGHSLALVAVAARLSTTVGAEVPVVELFRRPTIRLLAGFLDGDLGSPGLDQAARRVAARRERLRLKNQGRAGGATDRTGDGIR